MSIVPYKNLAQIPNSTPSGAGGLAVYQTSKNLADRFGQSFAGFNVKDYNSAGLVTVAGGGASGSATTTTGNISNGSPTLTVASAADFVIGQGILVKGAGAAGAHLVTTISNIVGTTFTLANNASTTVTGNVVQHDDTAAINSALAACFNAGGGDVFVPNGFYRTNGPFQGSTNSILTLPQTYVSGTTQASVIKVGLIGQATGFYNIVAGALSYVGGTAFDCTDAPTPSGTVPSWYAAAPFIVTTGIPYDPGLWNKTMCYCSDFATVLPVSTPFSGLNFGNSWQAIIGDNLYVIAQATGGDIAAPTAGTVGFVMPQSLNNIKVRIGRSQATGFNVGIYGGEHMILHGAIVSACNVGLELPTFGGLATGDINVLFCPLGMEVTGNPATADLRLSLEIAVAGHWYSAGTPSGVYDPSNFLHGTIRYYIVNNETGSLGGTISQNGAGNAHLVNIYA